MRIITTILLMLLLAVPKISASVSGANITRDKDGGITITGGTFTGGLVVQDGKMYIGGKEVPIGGEQELPTDPKIDSLALSFTRMLQPNYDALLARTQMLMCHAISHMGDKALDKAPWIDSIDEFVEDALKNLPDDAKPYEKHLVSLYLKAYDPSKLAGLIPNAKIHQENSNIRLEAAKQKLEVAEKAFKSELKTASPKAATGAFLLVNQKLQKTSTEKAAELFVFSRVKQSKDPKAEVAEDKAQAAVQKALDANQQKKPMEWFNTQAELTNRFILETIFQQQMEKEGKFVREDGEEQELMQVPAELIPPALRTLALPPPAVFAARKSKVNSALKGSPSSIATPSSSPRLHKLSLSPQQSIPPVDSEPEATNSANSSWKTYTFVTIGVLAAAAGSFYLYKYLKERRGIKSEQIPSIAVK